MNLEIKKERVSAPFLLSLPLRMAARESGGKKIFWKLETEKSETGENVASLLWDTAFFAELREISC